MIEQMIDELGYLKGEGEINHLLIKISLREGEGKEICYFQNLTKS